MEIEASFILITEVTTLTNTKKIKGKKKKKKYQTIIKIRSYQKGINLLTCRFGNCQRLLQHKM